MSELALRNSPDWRAVRDRCRDYRRRILSVSQTVSALHVAPAFSCLEIVDAVYNILMRRRPDGARSDGFVMSKGHGVMAQYVVLEDLGILPPNALDTYCTPQGILGAHPDYGVPGIEASTGSLGHGLAIAAGMAYADRLKGEERTTFVVLGDGEMQEGSIWEAVMMAPNLKLDNLVVFLDFNDYQGLGRTTETHPHFLPMSEKLHSFGWEAADIDGHDSAAIVEAVRGRRGGKPLFLTCRTVKGRGVSYMIDAPIWHYRSPSPQEYEQALGELAAEGARVRNRFATTFYELGKTDPRLVVVVADISPAGSIAKFREDFPDRFINTGVAEQVMIGLCAGMAQRGLRPFAYTIATFSVFRPYEMIRDDLCYQDLPVTVVGIGGGVSYSTLGGTHHAMEDVALMTGLPNMQVIAPCDPAETEAATRWLATENAHPAYLRLGKAGEPDLTADALEPFVIGKVRTIRAGRGTAFLTYGPVTKDVLAVADAVAAKTGETATVVSVHTLKPLDADGIAAILKSHNTVVVVEEHVPHGGLGSRVKEIAWDVRAGCDLKVFSLQDAFIHTYGSHADVLAAHGLSQHAIEQSVLSSRF